MGSSERSATDDIVSGIMEKWAAAFSKLDAAALASIELTSGATDRRMTSPSRMYGTNPRRTPNSRNCTVTVVPAPPVTA